MKVRNPPLEKEIAKNKNWSEDAPTFKDNNDNVIQNKLQLLVRMW